MNKSQDNTLVEDNICSSNLKRKYLLINQETNNIDFKILFYNKP